MTGDNTLCKSSLFKSLYQGSPTLLLECYHPADFSYNPAPTHLSEINKSLEDCDELVQVCLIGFGAEICRTVVLQEQG